MKLKWMIRTCLGLLGSSWKKWEATRQEAVFKHFTLCMFKNNNNKKTLLQSIQHATEQAINKFKQDWDPITACMHKHTHQAVPWSGDTPAWFPISQSLERNQKEESIACSCATAGNIFPLFWENPMGNTFIECYKFLIKYL